jgi:hypothetical protein
MAFATYPELLAALPDNNVGLIDASDVRAIAEMLVPSWVMVRGQDVTLNLEQGVELDFPAIPIHAASEDDWSPDTLVTYESAVHRIAEFRALIRGDADVSYRLNSLAGVLCEASGTEVSMSALTPILPGDALWFSVLQDSQPTMTLNIDQVQLDGVAFLLKPAATP